MTEEPMVLRAVLPEGLAAEAAAQMHRWPMIWRPLRAGLVFVVVAAALMVGTGHLAWLLLVALWLVLAAAAYRMRRQQLGAMLRPGSEMTVEWGPNSVTVTRPISTVTFQYAGMTEVGRTRRLVQLGVPQPGGRRRATLSLPADLAPPEATARIATALPSDDPSAAATMARTFRCPEGFPAFVIPMSGPRVAGLAVLAALEALCLLLLALLGEWMIVLVLLGVLVIFVVVCTGPVRAARRRYRAGSLVGASFAEGRIVLALPDQRLDLPEARLRNLAPAGPELVTFVFSGAPTPLLVPRAVVADGDIDRLRALLGKAPIRASQRVDLDNASVR